MNSLPHEFPISENLKPYHRSFVNKLMDFFNSLPLPYWLTYSVFFLLFSLFFHVIAWMDGWLPAYHYSQLNLLFPLWLWGPLLLMTYLDKISLEALSKFSPLLDISDEDMQQLQYKFSAMPSQKVVINSFLWTLIFLTFILLTGEVTFSGYGFGSLSKVVGMIVGLFSFSIGGIIYYHSIHQLRLVNRTVKLAKNLNLFHLEPVYAFSRVTAQTGIVWILLLSLTFLFSPSEVIETPLTLAIYFTQVALAFMAFVLPLWTVHQRLDAQKRKLLTELNQRVEKTFSKLHHSLDNNDLNEVNHLNQALAGLNIERDTLNKIPTWPWPSGVLTGFLSAIMLPIFLFLLQVYLGDLLGRN